MENRIEELKEPMFRVMRTQRIASLMFIAILVLNFFQPNRWNFVGVGGGIIYLGASGFYVMHMTQARAGLLYDDWSRPSRFVELGTPEEGSVRLKLWVKNSVVLGMGLYILSKPFFGW